MSTVNEIPILRKQRATIKASCTRISKFVESCAQVNPQIAAQLEERRAYLDKYYKEYHIIQSQLEALDEQNESADRATFEDVIFDLGAKIRYKLSLTKEIQQVSFPSPSTSLSQTENSDANIYIRLPQINLPTFSGGYEEWSPFHDTFHSVIHQNKTLSDVQRLQYLKASLTNEAADIISSLEISGQNYDVAWQLLKQRYDNKRAIVQAHIKSIVELPTMNKENSVELRKIADGASKHVRALQTLKCPTNSWDDLLVYLLSSKLDSVTSKQWHTTVSSTELPTFQDFIKFISQRAQILETTCSQGSAASGGVQTRSRSNSKQQTAHVATVKSRCGFCNNNHLIYYCNKFLALPVNQRIAEIRKKKLCTNCLRASDHSSNNCKSGSCKTCDLKHNTLLHLQRAQKANSEESPQSNAETREVTDAPSGSFSNVAAHSAIANREESVMLSTAVVVACDKDNVPIPIRVLLDSGSQAHFISQSCLDKLQLKTRDTCISVSGINGKTSIVNRAVEVKIKSRLNSFSTSLDCIVTEKITEKLPGYTFKASLYKIPYNIQLADPNFNISSEVDMLIGAGLFWTLMCTGQIKANSQHPTLQKTRLGWILSGRATASQIPSSKVQSLHAQITNQTLHEEVSKFWRVEEIFNSSNSYQPEEQACEEIFLRTVKRNPEGRYVVTLPFRENGIHKIGDSHQAALRRFRGLERKFESDQALKAQYKDFLHEYRELGHMRLLSNVEREERPCYYMPHHGVFKSNDPTSKIRVVFDASCRTTTGISLNDVLMTGPVIQSDLLSIILRFRMHSFVLTADIVKMYRQVLLNSEQTRFHRILWREDPSQEIDTFELTTVTYGTASASYLVIKCLQVLADEYSSQYPIGAECIKRDFYVDDVLTGADSIQELLVIRKELVHILTSAGFELAKWSSNVSNVGISNNFNADSVVHIDKQAESKILGICWNPSTDTLHFSYKSSDKTNNPVTKRSILSEIARLYDPLGLLGPVVIVAKLIMQELWQSNLQWDESVPMELHTRWLRFKSQLCHLNTLSIPRCVKSHADRSKIQIHGFCDASESAFGACTYIRVSVPNKPVRSQLFCAKSRVAPLKVISLPRLELCAALLLTQLINKVQTSINISDIATILWSDSKIALSWIASPSRKWSTFVANRVGEIQTLCNTADWRHVPSALNPADLLSRGLQPNELTDSTIWWHGPEFLLSGEDCWPPKVTSITAEHLPEQKRTVCASTIDKVSFIDDFFARFSSIERASRVFAYILRFVQRNRSDHATTHVNHEESSNAFLSICRIIQKQTFPNEYKCLKEANPISNSSKLLSLTPFLDAQNLIRVGGRLKNSELAQDTKHPILLPKEHQITDLIIRRAHETHLHAGSQATMAAVRERFWPLGLRSRVRKIVNKCITCFKSNPKISEAIMGNLPSGRVKISKPFTHCGIDYAGPIILREGKRRNARNHKAYVAIFVCFSTKACHIELVSDLTSQSFLAALKRFISRRGKPLCLYSDNGTNFVGACKEIKELYKGILEQSTHASIKTYLDNQEISWSFIPPNAPHFGGLWEAAVKSAKYHMHRIVGGSHLTFEEMATVLCEIEAILNSRPITPISTDPNDLSFLTPGHFLIGTALSSYPCDNLLDVNENRLVRWQRVEQLRQHFWARWSGEYLNLLQERQKWQRTKNLQLQPHSMVLVRQQGLQPLQWLLGRVEQVYPGADGIARTASVRTKNGLITRPLSKLAVLPIEPTSDYDIKKQD